MSCNEKVNCNGRTSITINCCGCCDGDVNGGTGGQFVGVIGTLERKALTGATWTKIKLIPTEGNVTDINEDGEWVCPQDGIYDLDGFYGLPTVQSALYSTFQQDSPNSNTPSAHIGSGGFTSNVNVYPTISTKLKLLKGTNISFWVHSGSNQAANTSTSRFIIMLNTTAI